MAKAPHSDAKTLTRFILQGGQRRYPNAKGDLTILLNSVQLAAKMIASAAKAAGIHNLLGLAGAENTSGDQVKKLDVFSNDCMINCLSFTGKIKIMASEENEEPFVVPDADGDYCIVFDPLDGSSNIDANVSVGTIFGIYRCAGPPTPDVLLQPGNQLVCAGYAMYGDATLMVLSFGDEVNGFTLDPTLGEFLLTHPGIRIPQKGSIYSVNEGNTAQWDQAVRGYVESCKFPQNGKAKKARYIGSMVADVHRTLLYGGIFMYPSTTSAPNGKLRLVYELNPMAFLVEAAGGAATTGRERILDLQPRKVHERRPVFLGSPVDVAEVIECYKRMDAAAGAADANANPAPQ